MVKLQHVCLCSQCGFEDRICLNAEEKQRKVNDTKQNNLKQKSLQYCVRMRCRRQMKAPTVGQQYALASEQSTMDSAALWQQEVEGFSPGSSAFSMKGRQEL